MRAIITMLVAASSMFACTNSAELLKTTHMNLGVRIDTNNPRVVEGATKAMNYLTEVFDAEWHLDFSDACSIEFRPTQFAPRMRVIELGRVYPPTSKVFDGVVLFAYPATDYDLYKVLVHELFHLCGLKHNEDHASVMFSDPEQGGGAITDEELSQLKRHHLLRPRARSKRS
jgi:hypothetical protein